MVFEKGTYILCLSDLDLDPVKDCVYRVDNHLLLQRYNPESAEERSSNYGRKYKRTQTYTGWLCREGWDYVKLEVTGMDRWMGKEEAVTVVYPSEKEIEEAKTRQAKMHKEMNG